MAWEELGWGPEFQSTLSVRRATDAATDPHLPIGISIHALREESDMSIWPSASPS
ncbi:Uncharacterised protein [Bifidobacterium dentium]|nr:Uncharacterised protein [Bifidobacterium dentium]